MLLPFMFIARILVQSILVILLYTLFHLLRLTHRLVNQLTSNLPVPNKKIGPYIEPLSHDGNLCPLKKKQRHFSRYSTKATSNYACGFFTTHFLAFTWSLLFITKGCFDMKHPFMFYAGCSFASFHLISLSNSTTETFSHIGHVISSSPMILQGMKSSLFPILPHPP